jgi:glucose/arabinose dehydrogenase
MTDGIHTIALASLSTAGVESDRSGPLVLEVRAGGTRFMASLPDARGAAPMSQAQATFRVSGDLAFTADVIARGISAPAQLAWIPDGRLLVAEANGGVRVVRPGVAGRTVHAIDSRRPRPVLGPATTGAIGVAPHPAFTENGFVYAARLTADRPGFYRMHVVRLREAGDTLGDPATLFETSVIDRRVAPGTARPRQTPPVESPRVAFGPDGLLYVALPMGFTFYREPAASSPHASMLRLSDDGRPAAALTGIRAHPLGFTWDPTTGVFLPAFAESTSTAIVEPVAQARTTLARSLERLRLPVSYRSTALSSALVIGQASNVQGHALTRALLDVRRPASRRSIRVTMPIVIGDLADRIGDIAPGPDGTWFVVTSNAARAGGTGSDDGDVVVRLTPIR